MKHASASVELLSSRLSKIWKAPMECPASDKRYPRQISRILRCLEPAGLLVSSWLLRKMILVHVLAAG